MDQVAVLQARLQKQGQTKQQQAPNFNLSQETKCPNSISLRTGVYSENSQWNNEQILSLLNGKCRQCSFTKVTKPKRQWVNGQNKLTKPWFG